MIKYKADIRYLPQPFGLSNTGVICYINTLMQCLMSITIFNKVMMESEHEIAEEYKKIILRKTNTSYHMALFIHDARRNSNYQYNISPHQQEDIHEGFMLMLELMENMENNIPPHNLFGIRYKKNIICKNCKYINHIPRESCPLELYLEIPYDVTIYDHIMRHIENIPDYKCDKCNTYNSIIEYRIARLPPILVLLFKYNQYNLSRHRGKTARDFPIMLKFDSKFGPIEYRLVSYANHSGGLNSGHYWANCVRHNKKNNTLSSYRINDQSCTIAQMEPSTNVYMLFYEKI